MVVICMRKHVLTRQVRLEHDKRNRHTPNSPEAAVGSFTCLNESLQAPKPGLAHARTGKHASEAKKQWKTH
eukprot:m.188803 g.188803  ORF g.188803 m.188803 type:complete len:71 (+) comp16938_c1_seq10:2753-2965(+)